MTPEQEDALVQSCYVFQLGCIRGETGLMTEQSVRLAIRAAYNKGRAEGTAQERERCAKVCDALSNEYFDGGPACAAAIRRGN